MKQVLQFVRSGELKVTELPSPSLRPRGILVRTRASLISAGTERTATEFAGKSLFQKARARPDLVRQVFDKVRRDGLLSAIDSVQSRLDQPLALGYSSAGVVLAVGHEVREFRVGDRVACAGGGYASHAEIVYVPRNLAAKLPDNVTFEAASFVTLGAVALQGIRQSEAVLGDNVAVIGLGLIGQLTVQLLKAAGCRVFGIDLQTDRVTLARNLGANLASTNSTALSDGLAFTGGRGFDQVLITADTPSTEPVILAGELARDRGIVVAVGAVGMEVPRKLYYEKELDLRLSRSYGPGRYDSEYEQQGNDYPYAYVRWTEQRNMQAFLDLLAAGAVNTEPLISHRYALERAGEAYEVVVRRESLGVVLEYPAEAPVQSVIHRRLSHLVVPQRGIKGEKASLGVIGAGLYAKSTLLPALKTLKKVRLAGIASDSGVNSHAAAQRFGFAYCTTDPDRLLQDEQIDTVAILTRHDSHARYVVAALEAGKHVFVEKPAALTFEELEQIEAAYTLAGERAVVAGRAIPMLMVGYNRRFAPFVVELKRHLTGIHDPLLMQVRVNAGALPDQHWVHDPSQGGGRLLSEGCHFIDLLIHLTGTTPVRIETRSAGSQGSSSQGSFIVTLEFANGSAGTVTYATGGSRRFSKELIEVFVGGLSAQIDDFRSLTIHSENARLRRRARFRADKGHLAEWKTIVEHLTLGGPPPIPVSELFASIRATLAAQQSLLSDESVRLDRGGA